MLQSVHSEFHGTFMLNTCKHVLKLYVTYLRNAFFEVPKERNFLLMLGDVFMSLLLKQFRSSRYLVYYEIYVVTFLLLNFKSKYFIKSDHYNHYNSLWKIQVNIYKECKIILRGYISLKCDKEGIISPIF